MKKLTLLAAGLVLISTGCSDKQTSSSNPLLTEWDSKGPVPFDQIRSGHYVPALKRAISDQNQIIANILNVAKPDFRNTIEAFENSGRLMDKVSRTFSAVYAAHRDDEMVKVNQQIRQLSTAQSNAVILNAALFHRIEQVYKNQQGLDSEQKRLLEIVYKRFAENGALLKTEAEKDSLAKLNLELSALSTAYAKNLDSADKVPVSLTADEMDMTDPKLKAEFEKDGNFTVPLTRSKVEKFLTHCKNREARKKVYLANTDRGLGGDFNNCAIIENIITVRAERARLLGFETYADMVMAGRMNTDKEKLRALLNGDPSNSVMPLAMKNLTSDETIEHLGRRGEFVELQELLEMDIPEAKLEPWDYWFYARAYKAKIGLNETALSSYFELDNVQKAVFGVAKNLWGIEFYPKKYPVFHPDAKAFDVVDTRTKKLIGVFYADYFSRPGAKNGGAWCSGVRLHSVENGKDTAPVTVICLNYTKPKAGEKCYLKMGEVTTLFHEFGHAMHNLLSEARFRSLSGTSVPRDIVELPSQMMEHWATHETYLSKYANNAAGKNLVKDDPALFEKYKQVSSFGEAFDTVEYTAAALLDLEYHATPYSKAMTKHDLDKASAEAKKTLGVKAIQDKESQVRELLGMKKGNADTPIEYRYRSTNFSHIFSGGYDVGYYVYMWAEQYDCDAFALFEKKGNIFDQTMAGALRKYIYASGNTVDMKVQYGNFRKAAGENNPNPNPEHLFISRGLKAKK